MSEYSLYIATALLVTVTLLVSGPTQAASPVFDFERVDKVLHENQGPIEKTYGYLKITTDSKGAGVINVAFSNGSQVDGARFNARVRFLDSSGSVIKEEYFERRIAAADSEGAVEGIVSKPLGVSSFAAIQVNFYLSDVPGTNVKPHGIHSRVNTAEAIGGF